MERIIGVNDLRPRIGKILKEISKKREALIISSRSKPTGVLLSVEHYEELKKESERAKQLAEQLIQTQAKNVLYSMREKAEASGISAGDVVREIDAVRQK